MVLFLFLFPFPFFFSFAFHRCAGALLSYFDFLILRREGVLIHCRAGKSRSVLYTITYAMHALRKTLQDVYLDNPLVAQQRGGEKINPGTSVAHIVLCRSLYCGMVASALCTLAHSSNQR